MHARQLKVRDSAKEGKTGQGVNGEEEESGKRSDRWSTEKREECIC